MPELQSNDGTRVETHETNLETTIHGVNVDDPTHRCSAPECSNTTDDVRHDFSLVLGADMDGMVADWGEVEFCSLDCAREFVDHAPYHDLDARDDGHDTLIFLPDEPLLATVTTPNPYVPTVRVTAIGPNTAVREARDRFLEDADDLGVDEILEFNLSVETL